MGEKVDCLRHRCNTVETPALYTTHYTLVKHIYRAYIMSISWNYFMQQSYKVSLSEIQVCQTLCSKHIYRREQNASKDAGISSKCPSAFWDQE